MVPVAPSRSVWWKVLEAMYARGLTAIAGLALTVALPYFFNVKDVGLVYLVITYATVFSIFARFGLDYKFNETTKTGNSDRLNVKVSYVVSLLLYSLVLTCLLILAASSAWSAGVVNGLRENALSVALLGTAYTLSFFLFQLYRLDGAVIKASLSRGFIHSTTMVVGAILLSLGGWYHVGVVALFILVFMATLLNVAFYFYGQLRLKINKTRVDKGRVVIVVGSPKLMLYSLLAFAISDVDYIFIHYFLGAEDVAVYATVKRIALLAAIFIDIGNVVLPKILKDNISLVRGTAAETTSRRLALVSTVLSAVLCIFVIVTGKWFINALWGAEYKSGYIPLCILMITFVIVIALGFSEVYLLLQGDRDALLKSMLVAVLLVVVFNFVAVPLFGITGAATSFLISSLAMRALMLRTVVTKYNAKLYAGW